MSIATAHRDRPGQGIAALQRRYLILVRDLGLACAHAKDLGGGRALVQGTLCYLGLTDSLPEALGRAHADAVALADELGCAHVNTPDETLAIARGLADTLASARSLARAPARTDAHRSALARAFAGAPTTAPTTTRAIARVLTDARAEALFLGAALPSTVEAVSIGRRSRRVAPSASRLLAVAAWLLPTGDRARYAEEFRSEMWEIATAGGRRPTQLAYAARQVVSALRLRGELRTPRRRGAAP